MVAGRIARHVSGDYGETMADQLGGVAVGRLDAGGDAPVDALAADDYVGEPFADESGPSWQAPVAWVAAIVLLLVASGGPVFWARGELASLTTGIGDDIWIQALYVVAAGLVVAFCGRGVELLRADVTAFVAVGIFVAVLAASAIWSSDSSRTFAQVLLIAFGSAAALLGGATLGRTQVLTALFAAVQIGIVVSVVADLRDWPSSTNGAGDLTGVFGSNDAMGMIALLAAASTVMIMVVVLGRTPEEKLAAAAAGGSNRFRLPSMRTFNDAKRFSRMAQTGNLGSMAPRTPTSPGQVTQMPRMMRSRRMRAGSLGGVRASGGRRIAVSILLGGVLALDGLLWWLSQSWGSLFAVSVTAVVMLVAGLCLPGPGESTRRTAAGVVALVAVAATVALVVFRERVAEHFDREPTWSGRTTTWDAALDVARDRPMHGFGFDPGSGAGAFGVQSGFVQILLGAGLLGLVTLLFVMFVALRRSVSAAMLRPDALGVWVVGMAAYGIAANVNESFVSAFSLPWLLLVFALGHAVARREERYDELRL